MRWIALLVLVASCDLAFDVPKHPAADAFVPCTVTPTPGDYSTSALVFATEVAPSLSTDQLTMYMASGGTIRVSHFGGAWSMPAAVTTLDDPGYFDDHPSLWYDGMTMLFTRHVNGAGNFDLPYEAHKLAGDTWDVATAVPFPSALVGNDVVFGVPTLDGTRVIASHGLTNHYHLAELRNVGGTWTTLDTTGALYPVGGDVSDTSAQLSPDGCWMVFSRLVNGTSAGHDLMFATRGDDGNFGPPERLFTNPSLLDEQHPWLASDFATIYFADNTNLYVANRQ